MTENSGSRRQAREAAIQAIFSQEFSGEKTLNLTEFYRNFDIELTEYDFASWLVEGFLDKKKEIDSLLDSNASHWKIERMGYIDRSILRCALFESKESKTHRSIIINEYIEITKKFCDKESAAFINGILDQVMSK